MDDTSSSSSSSEYIPSDEDINDDDADTDMDEENNPPPHKDEGVEGLIKNFDYTNLAASLFTNNNTIFNFSTEKESLIKGSMVNTFKYTKSKSGIETRFFDTIKKFGGPEMQPLLDEVEKNKIKEKRFYVILRGRRNKHKRIILSKCLLLLALKWRNQSKKDFGK
jgi:hypothetical protein